MSRAFVRDQDEDQPESLPELKVGAHPSFVTRRGLKLIEDKIAELNTGLADGADESTAARLERDLRYWMARRDTAQVHERDAKDEAGFGARVKFRRGDGPEETVEIVGEDEADPHVKRISYAAPLARAMTGAKAGEVVTFKTPQGEAEIEILAVDDI